MMRFQKLTNAITQKFRTENYAENKYSLKMLKLKMNWVSKFQHYVKSFKSTFDMVKRPQIIDNETSVDTSLRQRACVRGF